MSDGEFPAWESSDLYVSGPSDLGSLVGFRLAHRPETTEDALALLRAFWDVNAPGHNGIMFYTSDPDSVAKLETNPILERNP